MYVNSLISLQEDCATYEMNGKRITGHVTLITPGMIRCYVQNLERNIKGMTYAFYVFGSKKDEGVKIGNLSVNKESKWLVNEKGIMGTGLQLQEVDAVAIVAEGEDIRTSDVVLTGFLKDRYAILPLLERLLPRKTETFKENKLEKVKNTYSGPGNFPVMNQHNKDKQEIPNELAEKKSKESMISDKEVENQQGNIGELPEEGPGPVIVPCKEDENQQGNIGELPEEGPGPVIVPCKENENQQGNIGELPEEGPGPVIIPSEENENREESELYSSDTKSDDELEYLREIDQKLKELQMRLKGESFAQKMEGLLKNETAMGYMKGTGETSVAALKMKLIFELGEKVGCIGGNNEIEWAKIPFAEFLKIPSLDYDWCTQPFISFSFYKYNEILLGKCENKHQYYIGIPDIYQPDRKKILEIDKKVEGFLCKKEMLPTVGEYGYWVINL